MKRFSMFLLVFLVCLSMAELIVRFAVRAPANEQYAVNRDAYAWNPYASVLRTDEGYARFTMDERGFNNDPLPDPLPEERLLILGDSFVQSVQVMRRENFITLLNQRLHDQDAYAYNAGLAGNDPSSFPVLFEEIEGFLKPQYVLLCLSENDVSDLTRRSLRRGGDGRATGFARSGEAPDSFGRMRGWVYAHSALITHLKFRYDPPIRKWLHEKFLMIHGGFGSSPVTMPSEDLEGAREKWKFVLDYFANRGVTITVLVMPMLENRVGGSSDLDYQGIDVLAREAERLGIPVLDANSILVADFQATGIPSKGFANSIPGTGHLNQYGHRLLADMLAQHLDVLLR